MSAPNLPWDINEARRVLFASSKQQQAAEENLREAVKRAAIAADTYAQALATKIVELRAEGQAATLAKVLAQGDPQVAKLGREKDIAEGVREAMVQAGWRASSDRKDAQALSDWSMRREFAEGRQ